MVEYMLGQPRVVLIPLRIENEPICRKSHVGTSAVLLVLKLSSMGGREIE